MQNRLPVERGGFLLAAKSVQRAGPQNAVLRKLGGTGYAVRQIVIFCCEAKVASLAANRSEFVVRKRFGREGMQQLQHGGLRLWSFRLVHDDG